MLFCSESVKNTTYVTIFRAHENTTIRCVARTRTTTTTTTTTTRTTRTSSSTKMRQKDVLQAAVWKAHHTVLCTCAHAPSTWTTPTLTLLYIINPYGIAGVRSSIICVYIYMYIYMYTCHKYAQNKWGPSENSMKKMVLEKEEIARDWLKVEQFFQRRLGQIKMTACVEASTGHSHHCIQFRGSSAA